jgi:hypothetical protein
MAAALVDDEVTVAGAVDDGMLPRNTPLLKPDVLAGQAAYGHSFAFEQEFLPAVLPGIGQRSETHGQAPIFSKNNLPQGRKESVLRTACLPGRYGEFPV